MQSQFFFNIYLHWWVMVRLPFFSAHVQFIIISFLAFPPEVKLFHYEYSQWTTVLGYCIGVSSFICVPAYMVYHLLTTKGTFKQVLLQHLLLFCFGLLVCWPWSSPVVSHNLFCFFPFLSTPLISFSFFLPLLSLSSFPFLSLSYLNFPLLLSVLRSLPWNPTECLPLCLHSGCWRASLQSPAVKTTETSSSPTRSDQTLSERRSRSTDPECPPLGKLHTYWTKGLLFTISASFHKSALLVNFLC